MGKYRAENNIHLTFGRQSGDAVIEFNSRSLDLIFKDHVHIEPNLFSKEI